MAHDPQDLFAKWTALREGPERLHALEIAVRLGVSECELLATACGAAGALRATRLSADWAELVEGLPALGPVKTVTRNPHAVIEVEGAYDQVKFFGPTGHSLGRLDLRIFIGRWRHGFAVAEETPRGTSRGLQFFDDAGRAIHKLYLRPQSDAEAFEALVRRHTAPDQGRVQAVSAAQPAPAERPDAQIDVEGLRGAWRAMTDTHQFFGMLRQFEVGRIQALRLVGGALAVPLEPTALETVLHRARDAALPFMVFVGNAGMIQIHTAAPKKVVQTGAWLNVLDPGFNLHVRSDQIDQAWLVRKPTADGDVTAVELYDRDGQQIALLVGQRKPGVPESGAWRALAESLPRAAMGA